MLLVCSCVDVDVDVDDGVSSPRLIMRVKPIVEIRARQTTSNFFDADDTSFATTNLHPHSTKWPQRE
jgi:hypothetical protein